MKSKRHNIIDSALTTVFVLAALVGGVFASAWFFLVVDLYAAAAGAK